MTRWLAGTFDPSARADPSRLTRALEPHAAALAEQGALRVAYTGAPATQTAPLCLLDGFLDNASELSQELETPREDVEVLLAAGWRRWGNGLLGRMRGDFALAIWDQEREQGLLARDQLGVRSLFLHEHAGTVSFASEVSHLLALLPRRPPPDRASVAHWISMSNRPGSATLYEGIRRLDPGGMLLLGARGTREESYWAPRFQEPLAATEPALAERVRRELGRAVQRRLSPDGLTGILMSGGLDSASVASVAATEAPGRVAAFSGVFPDHPEVDESSLIDELRERLALPGIDAEVRPGGLLACAIDYSAAWQMPQLGWGDFWTLPLLRAAAGHGVRVSLGGDGGDEIFGARSYLLADRLRAGHPLQALELAKELPGAGDHPARREVARIYLQLAVTGALPYRVHTLARRPLEAGQAPSWLTPESARILRDTDDPVAWKRLDGPRWWAHVAHGLTRVVQETGVFEHHRRLAASAGIAARHPLFDLDLLELALRQPPTATLDRYRNRPVLRAAMQGLLPDSVRLRPQKAWFDSVIVDTLAGPDGKAIRGLLTGPGTELRAYTDIGALEHKLFSSDPASQGNRFTWLWQVWRLLTAEVWLRAQSDPELQALSASAGASEARVELHPAAYGEGPG